jgi:hypothetical protein
METVDVIEIWQPVKEGGEAYSLEKGSLKRVALIVNGYPFYLEKDWGMEKITMSKEEAINKGLITTFPDTQEKKCENCPHDATPTFTDKDLTYDMPSENTTTVRIGGTNTPTAPEWEESLIVEVMEDYIREIDFGAKLVTDEDLKEHKLKMQQHFDKLKSFISSLLQAERERTIRSAIDYVEDQGFPSIGMRDYAKSKGITLE